MFVPANKIRIAAWAVRDSLLPMNYLIGDLAVNEKTKQGVCQS